jgi:hypothetical protein
MLHTSTLPQGILQSLSGLPPIEMSLQSNAKDRALGEVAKLQRTWATVVIVGAIPAWEASNTVKDIAGRVANLLQYEPSEVPQGSQERLTSSVFSLGYEGRGCA